MPEEGSGLLYSGKLVLWIVKDRLWKRKKDGHARFTWQYKTEVFPLLDCSPQCGEIVSVFSPVELGRVKTCSYGLMWVSEETQEPAQWSDLCRSSTITPVTTEIEEGGQPSCSAVCTVSPFCLSAPPFYTLFLTPPSLHSLPKACNLECVLVFQASCPVPLILWGSGEEWTANPSLKRSTLMGTTNDKDQFFTTRKQHNCV